MKRIVILIAAFAAVSAYAGQGLNVIIDGTAYNFPAEGLGVMEYSTDSLGKNTVSIGGTTFLLSDIDRMEVVDTELENNTVLVNYSGTKASVTVAGNIFGYVSAEIENAAVSITQSEIVSDNTCGEITYILKGSSDNGSFYLEGSYKCGIELDGLSLTNQSDAALNIQNGKRVDFKLNGGTVNSIADGAGGSQKGAIVCKGHLEFKGKGTLNVKGNASHAIQAKEYVEVKNCTINIEGAVKDGINCTQYFLLESGTINIDKTGDDGIQCDHKDNPPKDEEDTGNIEIRGGTLNVSITATAAKALKAEGDFIISGGEVTAATSGAGAWDSEKNKTKASACIGTDGSVEINGGTMNLTATGGGGKGISCDGTFVMNGGTLNIITSGGVLAYVNNTLNQNYTGNTDRLDSDCKSSPKGIKSDGDVTINGGNINVKTTGHGGEGIESKAILTVNDGKITVRAYDDGINSSSHLYIKGGELDIISTNNDGIDSNGNLYIQGGTILAFGGGSPECGLDANEEDGYSVFITGGKLLAVGGGNSCPAKSESTQAYVITNLSVTAGSTVSISSSDETFYTFSIPSDYSSSSSSGSMRPGGGPGNSRGNSVLISVPQLVSGTSYTVMSGNDSTSATARLTGGSSMGGPGGR